MADQPSHFRRFLGHILDRQVVILWSLGLFLAGLVFYLGAALAPFLVAVILAYILEGAVGRLVGVGLPRFLAVGLVFTFFLAAVLGLLLWLIPLLVQQLTALVGALPSIATSLQTVLTDLQAKYVDTLNSGYFQDLIPRLAREVETLARQVIGQVLSSVPGLLSLVIYLFLIPLLVLLFLKDKALFLAWLGQFLPHERQLLSGIIKDVDQQMGHFFRGKLWEMVIVSVASVSAFLILGCNFAMLLGLVSGVSVLIPFLGVLLAAAPIVLVALFQWGFSSAALPVLIAFMVIQLLDGYLLQPVLLGNIIRIHPAAMIFAVLTCGHLWGLMGLILAFPLTIVVKSILDLALPYIRTRAASQACEPSSRDASQD